MGWVEQEVEAAFQVGFSRWRQLDDKIHRPSFLRWVSNFACSRAKTASTGTEAPVWWYASDAACARARNAVWTCRNAMAFRNVASTNSVSVSPTVKGQGLAQALQRVLADECVVGFDSFQTGLQIRIRNKGHDIGKCQSHCFAAILLAWEQFGVEVWILGVSSTSRRYQ
jgi:hypothetical protein